MYICLFYIIKKQTTADYALFISEYFTINQTPAFAHFGEHEQKAI